MTATIPITQENWATHAACRDVDPALFFSAGQPARRVLAICARCPVKDYCLADVLKDPSLKGVWAGTTKKERDRIHGITTGGEQEEEAA